MRLFRRTVVMEVMEDAVLLADAVAVEETEVCDFDPSRSEGFLLMLF